MKFQFTRNLPVNLADEASTAKDLVGLVSQETLLSTLSFVDDAKNEIKRMKEEQKEQIKSSLEATDNLTDQQKAGVGNGKAEE